MISHARPFEISYQLLIPFATHQMVYNNDGIRIHKLATSKCTRKTFHACLKMRELHYAGGDLFVSGRGLSFCIFLKFLLISLAVSILRLLS